MTEATDQQRLFKRLQKLPDFVLLARMRALGFWPAAVDPPADPQPEAIERAELEARLKQLSQSAISQGDLDRALREERKRRWEASKQRRSARKLANAKAAAERAAAWKTEAAGTVVHVGRGHGAGLSGKQCNQAELNRRSLPVIVDAPGLAAALGIDLSRLRWLTFHRDAATLVHYHRYQIPKKSGGMRAISAPKPELASCQQWILEHILAPLPLHPAAHGFVPGRSSVSNAQAHVGRAVVINLDLKDFFPSIGFARVLGIFANLGYSRAIATLLALLTTEPPRVAAGIQGDPQQRKFFVAIGERVLPQGACTSPALSNLLCGSLDRRLSTLATSFGFNYTRYADDLTFSGDAPERVGHLLAVVRKLLRAEDLSEHPEKTRVMRASQRQEVTGLVVNQGLGLKREDKRRLRAILHNVSRHGLNSQNREQHPNFAAWLRGWVAYAAMAEKHAAPMWWAKLRQALARREA